MFQGHRGEFPHGPERRIPSATKEGKRAAFFEGEEDGEVRAIWVAEGVA